MKLRNYLLSITVMCVILLLVLTRTRPDTVPLYILIIPFVCVFGIFSLTIYTVFRNFGKKKHTADVMTFSLVMGSLFTLSLGLNSVGSLLPREIAIVALFFGLLVFYALKRRRS